MRTLIQDGVAGIPPVVETAARQEGLNPRDMARAVARGHVVIPANPRRPHRICAIGEDCRVKINVNIGTSGDRCDPELERQKAMAAIAQGTDTLMDLSTRGDIRAIREMILSLDITAGTVPIYEAVLKAGNAVEVDAGWPTVQIVSGAGAKVTRVRPPAPPFVFTSFPPGGGDEGRARPGFVRHDFLPSSCRAVFYEPSDGDPLDMGMGWSGFLISPSGTVERQEPPR